MKKNMNENYELLERRLFDSLYHSDTDRINYELSKIDRPTLVSGVGGSSVVADYASKILSKKNGIITKGVEPRDFKYMNTDVYSNVLSCSYSGNNYGVDLSFDNNLKHYLLAGHENENSDVNLIYRCDDPEKSFISLSSTLIPCAIMLNYSIDGRVDRIIDNTDIYDYSFDTSCDAYEIFSGYETSAASKFLESTMVESGIGIPIVHDKYSYCHGRSTLSTVNNNIAIFFDNGSELDKLLLSEIKKYYKDVIVLDSGFNSMSEYILLLKCMYLTKYIAESKDKDLSIVEYNPIVKKLYKYNGGV